MNAIITYRYAARILAAALGIALLATTAEARVRFVIRAHSQPGHSFSNVWCYVSGVNDGKNGYISARALRDGLTVYGYGRGNSHTGNHSHTGGQYMDAYLSNGNIFSLHNVTGPGITDSTYYTIWNPLDGSLVYTNTGGFGGGILLWCGSSYAACKRCRRRRDTLRLNRRLQPLYLGRGCGRFP